MGEFNSSSYAKDGQKRVRSFGQFTGYVAAKKKRLIVAASWYNKPERVSRKLEFQPAPTEKLCSLGKFNYHVHNKIYCLSLFCQVVYAKIYTPALSLHRTLKLISNSYC